MAFKLRAITPPDAHRIDSPDGHDPSTPIATTRPLPLKIRVRAKSNFTKQFNVDSTVQSPAQK
jgi:hypothetical protein